MAHIQNTVVGTILLSIISTLSLMIPPTCPSSRIVIILFSMISILFLTPPDLPQPSLLSNLIGSCHLIHLLLLLETVFTISLANSTPTSGCTNKLLLWLVTLLFKGGDRKITQQETSNVMARVIDYICLPLFFVTFVCQFALILLSQPVYLQK